MRQSKNCITIQIWFGCTTCWGVQLPYNLLHSLYLDNNHSTVKKMITTSLFWAIGFTYLLHVMLYPLWGWGVGLVYSWTCQKNIQVGSWRQLLEHYIWPVQQTCDNCKHRFHLSIGWVGWVESPEAKKYCPACLHSGNTQYQLIHHFWSKHEKLHGVSLCNPPFQSHLHVFRMSKAGRVNVCRAFGDMMWAHTACELIGFSKIFIIVSAQVSRKPQQWEHLDFRFHLMNHLNIGSYNHRLTA